MRCAWSRGRWSLICMTRSGHDRLPRSAGHPPAGHGPSWARRPCSPARRSRFDVVGAEFVRSIEPGELVQVDHKGTISSHTAFRKRRSVRVPASLSMFTSVVPTPLMDGRSVYEVRKAHRRRTRPKESPGSTPTSSFPVPDSGVPAAIGYAQESGIPFELGIIRSHYVGRTFIQPSRRRAPRGREAQAQCQPRHHPGQARRS